MTVYKNKHTDKDGGVKIQEPRFWYAISKDKEG